MNILVIPIGVNMEKLSMKQIKNIKYSREESFKEMFEILLSFRDCIAQDPELEADKGVELIFRIQDLMSTLQKMCPCGCDESENK